MKNEEGRWRVRGGKIDVGKLEKCIGMNRTEEAGGERWMKGKRKRKREERSRRRGKRRKRERGGGRV